LVVVEAGFVLGRLKAFLDCPAGPGSADGLRQWSVRGCVHQVVGAFAVVRLRRISRASSKPSSRLPGRGTRAQAYPRRPWAPSPAERVSQACSGRIAEMVRAFCPRGPHRCLEEIART
jgi:hypothetical protein